MYRPKTGLFPSYSHDIYISTRSTRENCQRAWEDSHLPETQVDTAKRKVEVSIGAWDFGSTHRKFGGTMIKSKAWNWDIVNDDFWTIPSEDVYYYLERWSKLGYKRFLDLGCGLGRHSIFFAENGFEVDAFDLSESGLEKFVEQIQNDKLNIHIRLGDMLSLPYEDNYFDCILAYHSIYHTDSMGIKQVIAEIFRVLKKDGEALLTFNSKNNPSFTKNIHRKIDENTVLIR
jgi:SAM-dependent methyltransferase